jgi:hypothetical protein
MKLLVIQLSFILSSVLISSALITNNKKCVQERTLSILNSTHRQTILCEAGKKCLLKSSCCALETCLIAKWTRTTKNHQNTEPIIFSEQNEKHLRTLNDLEIEKMSFEDEGIYFETLYETTIVREYHVTVVEQLVYYPVNAENGTVMRNEQVELEKQLQVKYPSLGLEFLEGQVSKCQCFSNDEEASYTMQVFSCFIVRKKTIAASNSTENRIEKYVASLVMAYSGRVNCESTILPIEFKMSIIDVQLQSYKVYNTCSCDGFGMINNNYSSDNETFHAQKRTLFDLPESILITAEPGKSLKLLCELKPNETRWPVKVDWLYKGHKVSTTSANNRIYVDRMRRLNVNRVKSSDSAVSIACFVQNETRVIYVLVVDSDLTEKMVVYGTNTGVIFFCTTLLVILVVSARKPASSKRLA